MTVPLVPAHYLLQIQQYLTSIGKDSEGWLTSHHLTQQEVVEGTVMLAYPRYEKLILSAIELAEVDDIGIKIGEQLTLNSHGTLGFALRNCSNLRQVLAIINRYSVTRTPLLDVQLKTEQGDVLINLIELHDITAIRRCFLEAVVTALVNTLQNLVGNVSCIEYIGFPYDEPSYGDLYRTKFKCKVEFSQECCVISLCEKALSLGLKESDEHSFHLAKGLCEKELQSIPNDTAVSSRVRGLLAAHQSEFLSLEHVAKMLNTTTRTLHRNLQKEHTSFQQLVDEIKHMLAIRYLEQSHASVKQTAYQLGYSDVANFRRAFKRWEGVSPNDFRLAKQCGGN